MYVPLEEIMAATGLGKIQVRNDVRNGYLPGHIDHRGQLRVLRVEWDALAAGEWQPIGTEAPKTKPTPIGITTINNRKAS